MHTVSPPANHTSLYGPQYSARARRGSGTYPSNYSDATAYQYSRNIVFAKGGWGWDQACYHTYFLEQVLGLLPQPHCPRLVVDYRADIVLSIGCMARQINWKIKPRRLGFNTTGAMPCVLHGNGVRGKPLYQKVQRWWRRQTPQSDCTVGSSTQLEGGPGDACRR